MQNQVKHEFIQGVEPFSEKDTWNDGTEHAVSVLPPGLASLPSSMLDGAGLRDSWYGALETAQNNFRQLLTTHSSPEWKRINDSHNATNSKGKGRASSTPQPSNVIVHRKVIKSGTVYRAVLDVPLGESGIPSLDACKAILVSPELRQEWDPAVEAAHLVELCDQVTRIVKTNFTLGWPASPRDAVIISRTFNDATTLIDVSTSLPRSPNEPAYLRPSPPYVRSEVALYAWCIQILKPQSPTSEQSSKPTPCRLRLTCFWQHDLRAVWNFGTTSSMSQQLSAMMMGFYNSVKSRGTRIPLLTGYGNGVSIEHVRFEIDREALTIDYSIVPEEDDHSPHTSEQGLEELHAIREHCRLARSIECSLPSNEGWDVQLSMKASSEELQKLPWTPRATLDDSSGIKSDEKIIFNVQHAQLPNDHAVLKVTVVIELSGPSSGLRLNGIPTPVDRVETRDPSSYYMSQSMLQDASSVADYSLRSQSTFNTATTSASSTSTIPDRPVLTRTMTERTASAQKAILARVKRNYIYFSSLLQEPEAKWKRTTEARGVSIAQLDSIDPTLVVYRAEATFVGLGLWDLYAAVATPGARAYWDKLYDDAVLLEDVNPLTELWHYKTKPAWPSNGRDCVVLKTVYKSPTTIHVFAFSADDPNLYPNIPPVDPNVIRTQIDLQGWAIEALSPTTTLLTLLEQSDPKGWTNKTSIPQQMIAAVTGVGDFAIKCGGPPMLTRLEGAKANDIRYDHEKGSFRIEYEGSPDRRSSLEETPDKPPQSASMPIIECELRCDLDTWSSSLDIVIDPPPQTIACLRRHKLAVAGGGLWLTVSHDAVHASEERLLAIIRRAPQGVTKDKGVVMVNGAKISVDIEELPDKDAKTLAKQKRVKPVRIPLDQPPVLGVIRRRRAEWSTDGENGSDTKSEPTSSPNSTTEFSTSSPRFVGTWTRYFSYAVEQATTTTQQAVAAISPAIASGADAVPSSSKAPMQYALEALSFLQRLHSKPTTDDWVVVNEKDFPVRRKLCEEISSVIPVHKGEKVIEGVSAEEVASVLTSYDSRKQWDTRFDSANIFESFGAEAHTSFVVTKGGFPFRDRGFYLANLCARNSITSTSSRRITTDSEQQSDAGRAAIFIVSASFSPESVSGFSSTKYNSYQLPVGRVFVDGWILETLDPYTAENYAIPSTRCTRVVAMDYGGSIPAAVNSMINGMLPKTILAIETYMKTVTPPPFMRLPAAGLVISNRGGDDDIGSDKAWILRRRDSNRTLVITGYQPSDRIYHTLLAITPRPSSISASGPGQTQGSGLSNERTPRPSKIVPQAQAQPARAPSPSVSNSNDSVSTIVPSSPSAKQDNSSQGSGRSRSRDALRSPSMFTIRGEVRHPTDLLVSEVIIDSKLYPEGYEVKVKSRVENTKDKQLSLPSSWDTAEGTTALPITYVVYTLPPSPHHSSGLNTDSPPRHLLRLTLPTAQYQVSTIEDPLTGETRSAPPKPEWLIDLEEGRAILEIEIKPARSSQGKILADGKSTVIFSEKESLTHIGRDELLDARITKMDLLSRSNESGVSQCPPELLTPIAIAEHLLDETLLPVAPTPVVDLTEGQKSNTDPEDSVESADTRLPPSNPSDEARPADTATTGLLRFLSGYPNPLFRFSSSSPRQSLVNLGTASKPDSTRSSRRGSTLVDKDSKTSGSTGLLALAGSRPSLQGVVQPAYPLSTLIVVALIAFLLGSLLRSLISPADFIYVVSDIKDAEKEVASTGWREIRRLLELKYVLGGWDFQIAVVRRH